MFLKFKIKNSKKKNVIEIFVNKVYERLFVKLNFDPSGVCKTK